MVVVHFTIKKEEGVFVARLDSGEKFRNADKVSEYPTKKGLKIALGKFAKANNIRVETSVDSSAQEEETARKPMATTPAVPPSGKNRNLHRTVPTVPSAHHVLFSSLSLSDIEALYEAGMALVKAEPKVVAKRGKNAGKSTLDWAAGDIAVAHIVDKDGKVLNFGRFTKYRKGVVWASKSPKEKAEIVLKQQTYQAKRAEKEASLEERQVLNAMAREFGFPRFRELSHKASEGDARAVKIVAHIHAHVNAANDLKSELTLEQKKAAPFAVFGKTG